MHVATVEELDARCCRRSRRCARRSTRRRSAFADVVMLGRTHLQDATPVTLGQVTRRVGGAARRRDARDVAPRATALYPLALGGTAVGTGLNAPAALRRTRGRADRARRPASRSARRPTSSRRCRRTTRWSTRARRCARSAGVAMKIANDVRLYASGPRAGLRRDHDSRQRARLVDHAGQDQPDAERGADDGRRAGVRQRRRGRVRRHAGPLPAQRLSSRSSCTTRWSRSSCWPTRSRSFDERCARGIEPEPRAHPRATSTTR